jgi:histone-lysine N-methyltransferase SETMAR
VTTGALEEMHWEVLPHPTYSPNLAPSDFHLFGPLKEALGGRLFRADDEAKRLCKDFCKNNHKFFERDTMKVAKRWRRCIEVQVECVEKWILLFEKKIVINKYLYK